MENEKIDKVNEEQNIVLLMGETDTADTAGGTNKKAVLAAFLFVGLILMIIAAVVYYIDISLNYKELLSTRAGQTAADLKTEDNSYIGTTAGSLYILLLGIDKTEERASWLGVYRTDTIVLAKIDLDGHKIKLLSIPRDTYTFVPIENKFDKINHAYACGSLHGQGVPASIDAVNYFLDKQVVDYYFLMDMEPIPSIVDKIGGVNIDVEIDMHDHGANLSPGLQVLNGKQAFDYIHWRYSAGGDIDRVKRQQKFMRELYKEQREKNGIIKTIQIILKYRSSIQTDLSTRQIIELAQFMSVIPDGNVSYYYIPGDGQMINGISYWVIDKHSTQKILNDFLE